MSQHDPRMYGQPGSSPVPPGFPQPPPAPPASTSWGGGWGSLPPPPPEPATFQGLPLPPAYSELRPPVAPYPYPSPTAPQPVAYAPPAPPPTAPAPQSKARPVPVPPNPNAPVPVARSAAPVPVSKPVPVTAGTKPIAAPKSAKPVPLAVRVEGEPKKNSEEHTELADLAVKAAPPWLFSLIIHMVILIILAFITFAVQMRPKGTTVDSVDMNLVYAPELGEQLVNDMLDMGTNDPLVVGDPVLSRDVNPANDPFAAPPQIANAMLFGGSGGGGDINIQAGSDIAAPSIGLALTGREKGSKEVLLKKYGGNALTETSVKDGLEWLRKNQLSDGSWSLEGPYSGGVGNENKIAATALALLAFQAAGNTHKTGEHKRVVEKAWQWLLKQQDADGNFFRTGPQHHSLYTHAQATIAVCELYGMTKDKDLRGPAQKALNYCAKTQGDNGGWRYVPRDRGDTSVTGWFVMALQSGLMAGLEVQSPMLDGASRFLDSVTTDGVHYGYQPGQSPTTTMTAEALLCRQYLGWKQDDPRLIEGMKYLETHPINYNEENVYYWYYATQVAHHMEGESWRKWNKVLREIVPKHQVQSGREKGSWDPSGDAWGHHGGRLFTTCLSLFMLEVYYRHLPIYKNRIK